VIENSYSPDIFKTNKAFIEQCQDIKIDYITQKKWDAIRKNLSASLNDQQNQFLDQINLGDRSWSTPKARNIGLIVLKTLYPECQRFWSLDQDMMIPPNLELKNLFHSSLISPQINGCPDLSCQEWIAFYQAHIREIQKKQSQNIKHFYVERLIADLSLEQQAYLLNKYTDLKPPHESMVAPCSFVQREELYGGTYISDTKNCAVLFPDWYNEDWIFFQTIRQKNDSILFLDQSVQHESVIKSILNLNILKAEEAGEILSHMLRHNQSFEETKSIRLDILKAMQERNKELLTISLSNSVQKTLLEIGRILQTLMTWLSDENAIFYENKIHYHHSHSILWQGIISVLSNTER
jgi:hypothetical protein